jgi:glycosyltransferase involved in cell wall biosynthesis
VRGKTYHGDFSAIPSGKRILYVAYPLLTVSQESAGGAEQILWTLEREMTRRGEETTVAASAGSSVAGELFSTGEPCRELDDFERRRREHEDRIVELILRREREARPFALIHDMSGGFWPRAGEIQVPVLATLHLPRGLYPPQLFTNIPPNVRFNCVSRSQLRAFGDFEAVEDVIPNGIALDCFSAGLDATAIMNGRQSGLLWLGRICEEKAPHLALDMAEQARLPITIGGQVYPFSYHQEYFGREIAPRLQRMADARFVESPSTDAKRRLLRQAQTLLITSQIEETSSLVAMEAAASGTPVIAFTRGALPEVIKDGETGYLVNNVDEAIQAFPRLKEISREDCVHFACEHFSSVTMANEYAKLYSRIFADFLHAPGKKLQCEARCVSALTTPRCGVVT